MVRGILYDLAEDLRHMHQRGYIHGVRSSNPNGRLVAAACGAYVDCLQRPAARARAFLDQARTCAFLALQMLASTSGAAGLTLAPRCMLRAQDFKPLNAVRRNGRWTLIDLDAAAKIGSPRHPSATETVLKLSEAFCPPEAFIMAWLTPCLRAASARLAAVLRGHCGDPGSNRRLAVWAFFKNSLNAAPLRVTDRRGGEDQDGGQRRAHGVHQLRYVELRQGPS